MIGTTQTQTHKHTTNDTNTHTQFVKKVFFEKINKQRQSPCRCSQEFADRNGKLQSWTNTL